MVGKLLAFLAFGVALAYSDLYCKNGGTFNCDCPYGYYGDNCEKAIDFCNKTEIIVNGSYVDVDICGLHGTCHNGNLGPICDCDPGWSGTYCKHDFNNCYNNPSPCEHNGTCENLPGNNFKCICPPLFTGELCDRQIDFCHMEIINATTHQTVQVPICGDHGHCLGISDGLPSGFMCDCEAGWTGRFCEIRIKQNCTHNGHNYPHNSTWNEECDSCICEFGVVTCSKSFWCPEKCAIYNTTAVIAAGIKVGCPEYENCVPENVTCAHETPSCEFPVGWCFPVGYVVVDQNINIPTNSPNGWQPIS